MSRDPSLTRIVAFDPGLSGAIAIVDGDDVLLLEDLPVLQIPVSGKKNPRNELDLHALKGLLVEHAPYQHGFVERVSAWPKQGATSGFRFGEAFATAKTALVFLGVPFSLIEPKAWQKHLGVKPGPEASRQRALQLFPRLAPQLARKRDGNRAAALLIALHGRHWLQPEAESVRRHRREG